MKDTQLYRQIFGIEKEFPLATPGYRLKMVLIHRGSGARPAAFNAFPEYQRLITPFLAVGRAQVEEARTREAQTAYLGREPGTTVTVGQCTVSDNAPLLPGGKY